MHAKKHSWLSAAAVFKNAMKELMQNDPLRMAGATAFFTTFALPPILVILIQVLKLILDPITIRNELLQSLTEIVGPEAVHQLDDVLLAFRKLASNPYITVGGFIFLLFVATTLFKIIRNSINQIWKVRAIQKKGIGKSMLGRVKAVAVIIVVALLFAIGVLAEAAQAFIGAFIFDFSPLLSILFNTALKHILSVLIVMIWFAILFRFLPDGRPKWSIAFTGAFLTAILFTIGKIILHWLLSYSNINTVYGTSASIVLLLLFVFYSALILFYGAAFTKLWGMYKNRPIRPLPHAMKYRLVEEEIEVKKSEE